MIRKILSIPQPNSTLISDAVILKDGLNILAKHLGNPNSPERNYYVLQCSFDKCNLFFRYPHSHDGLASAGIISFTYSTRRAVVTIAEVTNDDNPIVHEKKQFEGKVEVPEEGNAWFIGPVAVKTDKKIVTTENLSTSVMGGLEFSGQGRIMKIGNPEAYDVLVKGTWRFQNGKNQLAGPIHTQVFYKETLQFEKIDPKQPGDDSIYRYFSGSPENRKAVTIFGMESFTSPSSRSMSFVKYYDGIADVKAEAEGFHEIDGSPILLGPGNLSIKDQIFIGNWVYTNEENFFVSRTPMRLPNGVTATGESHFNKEGRVLGRMGSGSLVMTDSEELKGIWVRGDLISPNTTSQRKAGVTCIGSSVWSREGEFKHFTGDGQVRFENGASVIGRWNPRLKCLVGYGGIETPTGERLVGTLSLSTLGVCVEISGFGEVQYKSGSKVNGVWERVLIHGREVHRLTGEGRVFLTETGETYMGRLFYFENGRYGLCGKGTILNSSGQEVDRGDFWYNRNSRVQTFVSSKDQAGTVFNISHFSQWILKN